MNRSAPSPQVLERVAFSDPARDLTEIEIAGEIKQPFPFPVRCGACKMTLEFRFERGRFRYIHRRSVSHCTVGIRFTIWPEHIAELAFKTIAAQRPAEPLTPVSLRLAKWVEEVVVLREQLGPAPIEATDHYWIMLNPDDAI